MILYILFSFFSYSACPNWYGIRHQDNSWSFYPVQKPGSVEVEVPADTCRPDHRILKSSGGKFVLDASKKSEAEAEDLALVQAKNAQKQLVIDLSDRINAVDLDEPIDGAQMRSLLKDIRQILNKTIESGKL